MVLENREKGSLYIVYDGSLEKLAEELDSYCHGKYGDRCEFKSVSIQRVHPDDNRWAVHDFSTFNSDAARAIKNHLKTRRDAVNVKFGDSQSDDGLELVICRARNSSELARHTRKEHREDFSEDDLVVLASFDPGSEDQVRSLLEKLE